MTFKTSDRVTARTTRELTFQRPVCFYDDKEAGWADTEAPFGQLLFPAGTLVMFDRNDYRTSSFKGTYIYRLVGVHGRMEPFVLYDAPAEWFHILSPLEQLAECAE